MSSWSFNFTIASFPVGWSGNYNQFAAKMVSLMTATLVGNLMPGIYSQGVITLPTSDQGPIVMNGQIWLWNVAASAYQIYQSTVAVGPSRSPNALENGDCQIFQIAAGGTPIAIVSTASIYPVDRWFGLQGSAVTGSATLGPATAGILGSTDRFNTRYCNRVTVTGTQATAGASDFLYVGQRMTLQKSRILFDVTPSFSIWMRTSAPGTYCVFIGDAGSGAINGQDTQIVFPCLIPSANTWTKFTFPAIITPPYGSGTWGSADTDYSMQVVVVLMAGSNFQQSPALDQTWQVNSRTCDTNQQNLLQYASATFDFTLAQLEPGSVVSAFEFKDFQTSLATCQRYYQKSWAYGTAIGAVTSAGQVAFMAYNAAGAFANHRFVVPMRLTPAIGIYSPVSGLVNRFYNLAAASDEVAGTVTLGPDGISELGGILTASGSGFCGIALLHYVANSYP